MRKPSRREHETTNQGRHYQTKSYLLYHREALIMIFSKRPQRVCFLAGVKYQL